jgi:hypothetical protein
MDRERVQADLDALATVRSLGSSARDAWEKTPHGTHARAGLAAHSANIGAEAAAMRDKLFHDGVTDAKGNLTPAAREAGVVPGQAFRYRP